MIELIKERQVIDVYFSEVFVKKIHEDIFGKDYSWQHSSYTQDEFKEFLLKKEKEGGKRFILKKLSRKALLTNEAEDLLLERFVEDHSNIIEELSPYFDDAFLIEAKVRSKVSKNLGKERIRRELSIDDGTFEETYTKLDVDPASQIRKLMKNVNLEDYDTKQRFIRKLVRRGFNFDEIYQSLSNLDNSLYD